MTLAGVDGCKGGWIVALADQWPCTKAPLRIEFYSNFENVLKATAECCAVAVDMPIGLPDDSEPRACDLAARVEMGGQRSSVFLAPPRCCLDAKDPREFQTLHRAVRGVGAGLPVWGIVPKMLEVNLAFERDPDLEERVFEFHPELAWRRLAIGRQLASKKTAAGILERIGLLNEVSCQWAPQSTRLAEGKPAIDDVLDAIVGLAAAHAFLACPRQDAPRNSKGLLMRIH